MTNCDHEYEEYAGVGAAGFESGLACVHCGQPYRRTRGLPYGWWRDPDAWTFLFLVFLVCPAFWAILAAWIFDWKPWW